MGSVGVIPARLASTRFPEKPLCKILGESMISWVVKGALTSKRLTEILVATDDERIAREAERAGAKAVMTDPALPSGSDRVWAALVAVGMTDADVVVNIQGDEPLITGAPLDALVSAFDGEAGRGVQMATLGRPMDFSRSNGLEELQSQATAKIVMDNEMNALYFSRFPIPFSRVDVKDAAKRSDSVSRSVLKHVGIYAYRPRFLETFCAAPQSELEILEGLEQLRALSLGAKIRVIRTEHESWGVDTPGDVEKIEKRLLSKK